MKPRKTSALKGGMEKMLLALGIASPEESCFLRAGFARSWTYWGKGNLL